MARSHSPPGMVGGRATRWQDSGVGFRRATGRQQGCLDAFSSQRSTRHFVRYRRTDAGRFGESPGIALDSTGRVLLTYFHRPTSELRVRRLSATGAADALYGGDGEAEVSVDSGFNLNVHVDEADRLWVMSGSSLLRFTADGLPDTTFGGTGQISARSAFIGGGVFVTAVEATGFVVDSSGGVVVVGYRTPLNQAEPSIILQAKFGSNGGLDSTFGNRGVVEIPVSIADFQQTAFPPARRMGHCCSPCRAAEQRLFSGWERTVNRTWPTGTTGVPPWNFFRTDPPVRASCAFVPCPEAAPSPGQVLSTIRGWFCWAGLLSDWTLPEEWTGRLVIVD